MNVRITWLALLVVFGATQANSAAGDREPIDAGDWTYRSVVEGVHPVSRPISLVAQRPSDFSEEAEYRGQRRRYAQLRYGSENSRRVVIVVDEVSRHEYDYYVDADRDRVITDSELLVGEGRSRTCELEAEIVKEDSLKQAPREISLRLSVTRTRLNVATLGAVTGEASLSDGTTLAIRQIDGNVNGLFTDARDRLQIDIDADGKWDPIMEQFGFRPVQVIGGHRYAVRSDRFGKSLTFSKLTGVGQLSVEMTGPREGVKVISFEAMIFSEDGSAYSLRDLGESLTVPIGRYALGSITLTVTDASAQGDNALPWHFVFSRSGEVRGGDWVRVGVDEQRTLEALGTMRFELSTNSDTTVHGDAINVNPRLFTHDGLLINLSCRGENIGSFDREQSHNQCTIRLSDSDGTVLSTAHSGFA